MTYWVIFPERIDDGAVLSAIPESGPKAYKYDHGISLIKGYPNQEEAVMCFDSQYPDRVKLYDFVPSIDSVLVVNSKVKNVLTGPNIMNIEYLPICLWDHQKVPTSNDYFILNPLGSVDFIDMEKSDYAMNPLKEGQIDDIDELVINENLPDEAKLFRATTKMDQIFIHDDVRAAFEEAGIKGYKLFEAEGWDGLDL